MRSLFFVIAGWWSVTLQCQESPYTVELGAFTLSFPGGNPSGCGEEGLIQHDATTFIFASQTDDGSLYINHINRNYDGEFSLMPLMDYDSMVVYDRYVNCYAFRISETEGVKSFDTAQSALPPNELFYYSAWQCMAPTRPGLYSFARYGHDQDYWQPHRSGINSKAFETWYADKMQREEWPEGDRREIMSYQRQLRIDLYSKGKKHSYTITFFHRDGEC